MEHESLRPPLRIALVTGVLNLGGTTTFLCNFGGELVRRGIPVRVLSFGDNHPLAADFARLQVPVLAANARKLYEDRLIEVLDGLREFRPNVVVGSLDATAFEVLRYVPEGVLRVGMVQSDDPGPYRTIEPYAGFVDAVGAVSETIRERLRKMPVFGATPLWHLPYGVPVPERVPERSFGGGEPLRILYLGRLDREQKRVHLFPEILGQLRQSGIRFEWTIAGTGREEAWLRAKLSGSAGETVVFAGKVDYGEVPGLLARHDVFLLASDYEGLPLSLLEAMASGLVPVVSDLASGIRQVVDATTGRLVALDNTAGYARAMVDLYKDPPVWKALSGRARARVERDYSVAAMCDRWLACLGPAMGAGASNWPGRWRIRPILAARYPWLFWPPVRAIRRLLRRGQRV